jgi:hypothetical protein
MEQDICEYVLEHYRGEIETALVETQRRGVEHGFNIVGNVGGRPQVQVQQGDAESIHLSYIQADYDIGIVFHTHPTSGQVAARFIQSHWSSADCARFLNYHVSPKNPVTEREDGFVRGHVTASVTRESDDKMKFVLRGMQTTDELVGKTDERREELALAMAAVVDRDYDAEFAPDWVEPVDAETIDGGMQEVAPGMVRFCESLSDAFEV